MTEAAALAEVWRGGFLESLHLGHAVIADRNGVVEAWGDPDAVILPRSSCKMIQALPLVETGAADGLSDEQLALACASHGGAPMHTERVARWLADLGLEDDALRCGAHLPTDPEARHAMSCAATAPQQVHNNCSGKHTGFLTLAKHLRAGPEYVEPDHPVQRAVRAAFEETTGVPSPGYAIDGCSAPNFATTVAGLARAMAAFAAPGAGVRGEAMHRLAQAMAAHPALVAGEGRACTDLMRAMEGVAVKTGAEGVFVAILPVGGESSGGLGVALKVADGATRASEAAIAALLVRLGVLDRSAPVAQRLLRAPLINWRGIEAGEVRPAPHLLAA